MRRAAVLFCFKGMCMCHKYSYAINKCRIFGRTNSQNVGFNLGVNLNIHGQQAT
ncbi:hypothetical protein SCLCIDRAFT_1062619 [Scleroderma citrinum Foug A]|uniref:Uncharacterized protein n=1 Tax=Scleroderma citrinum Foug A TaxID=1036808 RepID=A0A0C3DRW3_9AGAM|nr:hypothetical protein SCLCIDRAFT_1062619 [Scleroderma citrinum Foug A]